MRLLLIEVAPPAQRDIRLTTGLGYIASYLRRELPGIEVQITKGDPNWVEQRVHEYQPEIVGISTVSQYYDMAVEIADLCQKRESIVVIGGHHITTLPSSMTSSMDIGVIGEGEVTMLEICKTFLDRGPDALKSTVIPGAIWLENSSRPMMIRPRPFHDPIDDFPFPARDLMHIRQGESVGIITSRGCPYRCVFCASSAFWKGVRFHSAEYVVAEVKQVVEKYRPPKIYFWDDLFVADFKRVEKIASLLKREPMLQDTKYACTCRANLARPELALLLKSMNVVEVMIGFESMSPKTLKYLKPHVTVEDNRNAVEVFNRYGINVTGFFVIGSPRETSEEIEQTLDFVRTATLYRAEAYLLTPLPGTPVWKYALDRGLIDPHKISWDRLYIDDPNDPENGLSLSEVLSMDELRGYLREFERIRRRKERFNLIRRIPQHIRLFFTSPWDELKIVVKQLRTRRRGHI
jgi:anaerobic magnesium-protoporphyrin IX monomethyl ester cyclase